jgi:hypothetical protein
MSQGFASKRLVDAVRAGDVWKARKRLKEGGRHHELWSFMKHWKLLYDFTELKLDLESSHFEAGFVKYADDFSRSWFRLAPVVGYRAERARNAALAILSLKRRGLLSKDLSTLVAKTVYLSYENRYSEAWGRPADWATPIMQVAAVGVRLQLGILDCVTQLVDIIDRFFPLIMMILMILILF